MMRVDRSVRAKCLTIILVLLLSFGNFNIYSQGQQETRFSTAYEAFRSGDYRAAVSLLESMCKPGVETGVELKSKALLLMAACFDKLGDKKKAQEYLLELSEMIDNGTIDKIPEIPGIKNEIFSSYLDADKNDMISHNKPLEVSEVMRQKMIHAPRKSIEVKEKETKKKKFPWLLATLTVVIAGTAAVLLLTKKKEKFPDYMAIEWAHIPAGEFLMGDNFNEGDADELPVHPVYLDEYYISKYEISIEQYNYFCRQRGRNEHHLPVSPGNSYRNKSYLANYPAYNKISWEKADEFCEWLSSETGQDIHLPTEAQWEKAARGAEQKRYPWGNSEPDCDKTNFLGCENTFAYEVYAVDSYPDSVSPYGVHNMAGNVWEWCLDWYDPLHYSHSLRNNPRGPATGSYHVLRGGCAVDPAGEIRSANRRRGDIDAATDYIGFRIVKEVRKGND